jgi:hypothetical protein
MSSRRDVLKQTLAASAAFAGAPFTAMGNVVQGTPGRTALVVGNDRYLHNPLSNAGNDARAMAELLGQAGFAVDLKLNATRLQMIQAIEAFGKAMVDPAVGTGLFYYAGHAAQLDWRNFLLPVDGNVEVAGDVSKQCVDLASVIDRLRRTQGKTSMIFLDACRDDPFGPRFRPSLKGMSPYDAPAGSLLAFATGPGKVAVEVVGSRNGLYTEHLVRELKVKGVSVEDALKRVRVNVLLASHGEQQTWESTSLVKDVYLFPSQKQSQAELERQFQEELETWKKIRDSVNPNDWAGYLRRFPNGKFAETAQARLEESLARRQAATRVAAPASAPRPAVTSKPAAAPKPAAVSTAGPSRAPALLLGPELPVPARFKGSGNPNSAGSYRFRPVWTPGDEFVFNLLYLHSNALVKAVRFKVKRVDVANNRVEYTNGVVDDLMGSVISDHRLRFELPIQVNPTELQVGRKWSSRYRQSGVDTGTGEYDFLITGRELIKVPAGEFSAFRVRGNGWFKPQFGSNNGVQTTRWMVPGLNFPVRRELLYSKLAWVLVSARQAVSV